MNYEVMCMVDFVGVVDRTYFETYDEAAAWKQKHGNGYDAAVILPLNPQAEALMP